MVNRTKFSHKLDKWTKIVAFLEKLTNNYNSHELIITSAHERSITKESKRCNPEAVILA